MASYVLLVALVSLAMAALSSAQSSLPVGSTITVLDQDTCPSQSQRDTIEADADAELFQLIRDDVFPGLISGIGTGLSQADPADSCSTIDPRLPSALYWVRDYTTGNPRELYCDNQRTCCDSTGGWLRVVDLNFATDNCPSGWSITNSVVRGCVPASSSTWSCGYCSSAYFNTYGQTYNRVCGRVIGYQEGGPEAFQNSNIGFCSQDMINDEYVEGVSLTHTTTSSVRTHIWTFANGRFQGTAADGNILCPCTYPGANIPVPSFVGNDYFCDTGAGTAPISATSGVYNTNPLWDGEGCLDPSTCCEFNNPPWFCKQLDQPTNNRIEFRNCRGFGRTIITEMELYIR